MWYPPPIFMIPRLGIRMIRLQAVLLSWDWAGEVVGTTVSSDIPSREVPGDMYLFLVLFAITCVFRVL